MPAPAAAAPEAITERQRGLITLAVMLATIMQVLDTTIANVALPSMRADLGAAQDTITWVLTSYIVAAAIVTPLSGWLSDVFGRKRIFLVSVAGFVLTSMACGIAWSLETMVLFRLLQGVFGAAIVPLSQTFLLDINPRERHGQAMAVWGAGIMVGPIIGPTLGGWLTESFDWRWVFFINLPIGIVALAGCWATLPETARRPRRFDLFGFAMLALGVGALQLMLDRGAEVDWFAAVEIWLYAGLTLTGFWAFGTWILQVEQPFLEPRIFADRNFATGLVFIFVVGIILLASLALLPPMLSTIYGFPVITTGLVMAPRGVGTMVTMILAGRLVRRVDPRLLVVTGLLLTALSLEMMTGFTPQMTARPVVVSGFVQGLGLGLVFVPLSTVAFATLPAALRADATALFSLVRNIGSSIGISLVTVLLTHNIAVNHLELVSALGAQNGALQDLVAPGGALGAQGEIARLATIERLATLQALMIAYLDDFKAMMWVTLAAIPLAALLRRPQGAGPAPAAHLD